MIKKIRKIVPVCLLLAFFHTSKAQEGKSKDLVPPASNAGTAQSNVVLLDNDPPFQIVEEMPEFMGGSAEMIKFIQTNIRYPETAMKKNISGRCFVRFIVRRDGSLTNIEMLKGVAGCPECDAEALRVVKLMPPWKPGKQNGRNVSTYYNLPLSFQAGK